MDTIDTAAFLPRSFACADLPDRSIMKRLCIEMLALIVVFLGPINTPHLSGQSSKHFGIQFTNMAEESGIKFTHFKGNEGVSINREEFGPGVCVADFDGDGHDDIYFVNQLGPNVLYRNKGDGTFEDVTES